MCRMSMKNIDECNLGKRQIISIVFDVMILDMVSIKKCNPRVTE